MNYLGGDMPTFALNFSRPGAQVVAQYYTFLRLGRDGFRAVQQATRDVARCWPNGSGSWATSGCSPGATSCRCSPSRRRRTSPPSTSSTSPGGCASSGWLVPAYTFPANREDLSVLRVVCRNGFSADLADLLLEDLAAPARTAASRRTRWQRDEAAATAFHH